MSADPALWWAIGWRDTSGKLNVRRIVKGRLLALAERRNGEVLTPVDIVERKRERGEK